MAITKYYGSAITVDYGTQAGTLADTQAAGGSALVITGVTGSPGIRADIEIDGLEDVDHILYFLASYDGNPAHNLILEVYNGSTWDAVTGETTDFPEDDDLCPFYFRIKAEYVLNGKITYRLDHTSSGAAGHTFTIDHMFATDAFVSTFGIYTEVKSGSVSYPRDYVHSSLPAWTVDDTWMELNRIYPEGETEILNVRLSRSFVGTGEIQARYLTVWKKVGTNLVQVAESADLGLFEANPADSATLTPSVPVAFTAEDGVEYYAGMRYLLTTNGQTMPNTYATPAEMGHHGYGGGAKAGFYATTMPIAYVPNQSSFEETSVFFSMEFAIGSYERLQTDLTDAETGNTYAATKPAAVNASGYTKFEGVTVEADDSLSFDRVNYDTSAAWSTVNTHVLDMGPGMVSRTLIEPFEQRSDGTWISPDTVNTGLRRDLHRGGYALFDGTIKLTYADLSGVTISSYTGTGVPSIVGDTIEYTAGTAYSLTLSDGTRHNFDAHGGADVWDISDNGNHATQDASPAADLWQTSLTLYDETHRNHAGYNLYSAVFPIQMDAGLMDFSITNASNPFWIFPDGTTSTADRPAKTLASAGTVYLFCDDFTKPDIQQISDNGTNAEYLGDLADLPALTYYLDLTSCTNVTGSLADLPALTYYLNLTSCTNVTGSLADLPALTHYLNLTSCTNVTGDLADLPALTYYLSLTSCTNVTGDLADLPALTYYLRLTNCTLITGILPATVTATQIYIDNTGLSKADLEQSIINIESNGSSNGTLSASTGMPTIDNATAIAAVASLRGRGWTVTLAGGV